MPTTNAEIVGGYGENVGIERDRLSDGSIAWNVVIENPPLRIACMGRDEAEELAERLRDVSWIELR